MDSAVYKSIAAKIARDLEMAPVESDILVIERFLPVIEKMRREGAVILLEWDGERGQGDNGVYTAVVSGKTLKGEHFRIDADTIEEALSYIIVNYAMIKWGINL
ncbi:hypothetical protein [Tengunoibacter tsumagoiensis]|uniref:Uncharacterized protein n=1 Tax=Tengunoibacter tsumagoiensis TaxID=2014871 RepID=A0A402A4V9_9CHLR|nr:hypothetical protein [Tengunoibacter tsumagoiensis]GCE14140.1 hypothetical protein KTT_39990 [Tengunoibacter tsumagoiensis]